MIEKAFDNRRNNFKEYPSIPEGLDIINEDEIIVHNFDLDEEGLNAETEIDEFKYDKNYE